MVYDRRRYDGLTLEQKVDEALSILESLTDAFPDGPVKHREATATQKVQANELMMQLLPTLELENAIY